jgi:hypothetical protein
MQRPLEALVLPMRCRRRASRNTSPAAARGKNGKTIVSLDVTLHHGLPPEVGKGSECCPAPKLIDRCVNAFEIGVTDGLRGKSKGGGWSGRFYAELDYLSEIGSRAMQIHRASKGGNERRQRGACCKPNRRLSNDCRAYLDMSDSLERQVECCAYLINLVGG